MCSINKGWSDFLVPNLGKMGHLVSSVSLIGCYDCSQIHTCHELAIIVVTSVAIDTATVVEEPLGRLLRRTR